MKNPQYSTATRSTMRVVLIAALLIVAAVSAIAQTTTGGTAIRNRARGTYNDGNGNDFTTVSNTVTVTVANVSGLIITPDNGTLPAIYAGQTAVPFTFIVTNVGNFTDAASFKALGQSVQLSGPGTVASAFIDSNGNGTYEAGTDVDILGNAAAAQTADLVAFTGSAQVVVFVNISGAATAGQSVQVTLGDANTGGPGFDSQPADSSANEVSTVNASANGLVESRGDISASVSDDAALRVNLTAPAGPVSIGSPIGYQLELCNPGGATAQAITLAGAPVGSNIGVFIIAPIPVNTELASGQTFPAGTLFSTSPLTTSPLAATYTTVAGPLASIRRVAFNVGASLATGTCSAPEALSVTVVAPNANTPIYEIADAFAINSIGSTVTDQSGDALSNKGDGNSNYDEPRFGDSPTGTQGIQLPTLLSAVGAVFIGPNGFPRATGPSSTNDDYTNRSVTTGITDYAPGGTTDAAGFVIFQNTIENTGNADDNYTLSVTSQTAGFTVEISTTGAGGPYTAIVGAVPNISFAVPFGGSADIWVRVTAPSGENVLSAFETTVRATSQNTPAQSNETIDRLYTGFVRMDKSVTVTNGTGVGGASDAVPGAVIEYTIAYQNISSGGGANSSGLTANAFVITEDGSDGPNNWSTYTDHIAASATDSLGGVITGDVAGSNVLTDSVPALGPGQSGTFKFRRTIK